MYGSGKRVCHILSVARLGLAPHLEQSIMFLFLSVNLEVFFNYNLN